MYSFTHRAFLQAFLGRSTFTLPEARTVLQKLVDVQDEDQEEVNDQTVTNFISDINSAISPYDLEIRSCRTQTGDGRRIWALVNTTSDSISQLATSRTPDEIAFVKRLLDEMFAKQNTEAREVMAITSLQALRLSRVPSGRVSNGASVLGDDATAKAKDLTKSEAENVLKTLEEDGWFTKRRELYTLSERGLLELRAWLLETYNEPADDSNEAVTRIKTCQGCRDIVTIGQRCHNQQCLVRLHEGCVIDFFRSQRNQQICPICSSAWTGNDFVGPKAAAQDGSRNRTRDTGDSRTRMEEDGL